MGEEWPCASGNVGLPSFFSRYNGGMKLGFDAGCYWFMAGCKYLSVARGIAKLL